MILYLKDTPGKAHTLQNKNISRGQPIDRMIISHIYKALKNSEYLAEKYNALELALTVSTQLQQVERWTRDEKERSEYYRKTNAEKLREIANELEY